MAKAWSNKRVSSGYAKLRRNAIKLRELCNISRDLSADGGRKR